MYYALHRFLNNTLPMITTPLSIPHAGHHLRHKRRSPSTLSPIADTINYSKTPPDIYTKHSWIAPAPEPLTMRKLFFYPFHSSQHLDASLTILRSLYSREGNRRLPLFIISV
ncbi:hypothetical protein LXL04_028715 [Taraxacum kok-saghyz]